MLTASVEQEISGQSQSGGQTPAFKLEWSSSFSLFFPSWNAHFHLLIGSGEVSHLVTPPASSSLPHADTPVNHVSKCVCVTHNQAGDTAAELVFHTFLI